MSTYATVPEVGEQSSKPSTLGFKKVVAGAAVAAFLLAYNGLCVTGQISADSAAWAQDSGPYFALWECIGSPDQYVGYYGNENEKLHASLSHWDNGDCIGVRANLHVGKLVERFDCAWDEDHHVYSNWHME